MIKLPLNLIDYIIKHIHYCIWSFCLLYLVFDKVIHLPLDFLYNFQFIPDYILNLSELTSPKSIETVIPEITVIPENKEVITAINHISTQISNLNDSIAILNTKVITNNTLIESQIKNTLESSHILLNNNQILNDKLVSILQETNSFIKADTEIQVKIAKRVISSINDTKSLLTTIDTNILNFNNTLSNLDINKPMLNIQDTLTQVLNNQKELETLVQSFQDINIQGFNSILEVHTVNVESSHINMDKLFSKVNEVRNHNLELYRQLDKNIDFKFENTESRIVNQITEEINRPKTFSTEANKHNSWSKFFDKKS